MGQGSGWVRDLSSRAWGRHAACMHAARVCAACSTLKSPLCVQPYAWPHDAMPVYVLCRLERARRIGGGAGAAGAGRPRELHGAARGPRAAPAADGHQDPWPQGERLCMVGVGLHRHRPPAWTHQRPPCLPHQAPVLALLRSLPMLMDVMLLCVFTFFMFGVVALQLLSGTFRNR